MSVWCKLKLFLHPLDVSARMHSNVPKNTNLLSTWWQLSVLNTAFNACLLTASLLSHVDSDLQLLLILSAQIKHHRFHPVTQFITIILQLVPLMKKKVVYTVILFQKYWKASLPYRTFKEPQLWGGRYPKADGKCRGVVDSLCVEQMQPQLPSQPFNRGNNLQAPCPEPGLETCSRETDSKKHQPSGYWWAQKEDEATGLKVGELTESRPNDSRIPSPFPTTWCQKHFPERVTCLFLQP